MDARRWHRDSYATGQSQPLAVDRQSLAAMPRTRRIAYADQVRSWLRGRTILTPTLVSVADSLTGAETANRESPPGAKTILAVSGPNGLGKSTLVRRWAASRYREWTHPVVDRSADGLPVWRPDELTECDIVPVCWVNLHAAARIKDVNSQILSFFGLPSDGVARVQTGRVLNACDRHRIRLLVIDDVHLLKSSQKVGREVLDHVKHLNTELGEIGATMVLIGANLKGGGLLEDPQIAARLDVHHLEPYAVDTMEERRRWQTLLAHEEEALAPHLPELTAGVLHSDLAGHLWKRSQGYLGDLSLLLTEATRAALVDGSGQLTTDHLDEVRLRARANSAKSRLDNQGG